MGLIAVHADIMPVANSIRFFDRGSEEQNYNFWKYGRTTLINLKSKLNFCLKSTKIKMYLSYLIILKVQTLAFKKGEKNLNSFDITYYFISCCIKVKKAKPTNKMNAVMV